MTTYIQTDSGNLISRSSSILGSSNIILGGKTIIQPNVIIRGDLRRATSSTNVVVVAIGKYSYLANHVVIRPGNKSYKGSSTSVLSPPTPPHANQPTPSSVFSYYPVKIGDYVSIGQGSIIEAAQIGNGVQIGNNCIIVRVSFLCPTLTYCSMTLMYDPSGVIGHH